MWNQIDISWKKIDKIMQTPMKVANPTKFQSTYDEIYDELNNLPNKFRTFEALVSKKQQIMEYKKINKIIKELKTEAIKEHHWN